MVESNSYPLQAGNRVCGIVEHLDRDVEHGEDLVMLGYGLVLLAPIFAPLLPPKVLLPLMALVFALSATLARWHFYKMARKLAVSAAGLEQRELSQLQPIAEVFAEHPRQTLAVAFNPLKNLSRTAKSVLGGMLINPFWGPIFYMLGLQFVEDRHFFLLNRAVLGIERQLGRIPIRD